MQIPLRIFLLCEEISACWVQKDSQPGQGQGRDRAKRETAGWYKRVGIRTWATFSQRSEKPKMQYCRQGQSLGMGMDGSGEQSMLGWAKHSWQHRQISWINSACALSLSLLVLFALRVMVRSLLAMTGFTPWKVLWLVERAWAFLSSSISGKINHSFWIAPRKSAEEQEGTMLASHHPPHCWACISWATGGD